MPRRSPARFLAPLALFAAVLTIFLVARPQLGGSTNESTTKKTSTASKAPRKAGAKARKKAAPKAKSKTYTVMPGDVLGSIAESTGVPVADLLDFNDLEDAQSLSVGQKLKLSP